MFNYYYLAIKYLLQTNMSQQWQSQDLNYYTGQLTSDDEDAELLYTTPCTLIEFEPVEWSELSQGKQRGSMLVRIHIIDETNYDGEMRIIESGMMQHFQRITEHYKALHNKLVCLSQLPNFGSLAGTDNDVVVVHNLRRVRSVPDHDIAPYLHHVMEFSCYVDDFTAMPQFQMLLLGLNLDAEIKVLSI